MNRDCVTWFPFRFQSAFYTSNVVTKMLNKVEWKVILSRL